MSFTFKSKSKTKQFQGNGFQEKIAAGIVQKCINAQTKWSNYLQQKTEGLSFRAKKYCLLLFCLLSVGCSLYLVLSSLHSNATRNLITSPISIPSQSIKTGDERMRSFLAITKTEFQRIQRFRHYMDSLGRSLQGVILRDSMLSSRPGLMDSIRFVERLYELQNAKK